MKTYTPKPGELEEMGFTNKYDEGVFFLYLSPLFYIALNDGKWYLCRDLENDDGFEDESIIFIRSKEHLEQIILAFTKPK